MPEKVVIKLAITDYIDTILSPAFAALETKNFHENLDLHHDGNLDLVSLRES